MTDVTTGQHLVWQAADTTGIVGKLDIAMLAWMSTDNTGRDIATNDIMQITDQNNVNILRKKAISNGDGIDPITFNRGEFVLDGIKVPQLDGGELFITLHHYIPTSHTG